MKKALLLLLPTALVLGACDIFGNSEPLDFQLFVREISELRDEEPFLTARTEFNRIVVQGEIVLNCLGNAPSGNVVQVSRTQFRVTMTEQSGEPSCSAGERLFEFDAFIGPLVAGSYRVDLIYQRIGAAPETVLSQQFTL